MSSDTKASMIFICNLLPLQFILCTSKGTFSFVRETKCIISHLRRNHLATNSRLKSRQASSRSHSDKVAAIIIPNTRQNLEQSCLKQFFLGLCPVCNYGNYSNEPPSLNFKPQHQVASIELTRGMGHHDDLETRNSPILTQFYNLMSPKSNFPVFSMLPF